MTNSESAFHGAEANLTAAKQSLEAQRLLTRGITPDTRRDSSQRILSIADRRAAIAKAIELARPGDLVLLAGKGHETYQVIGNESVPLDDAAVAREALGRRRTNSGVV